MIWWGLIILGYGLRIWAMMHIKHNFKAAIQQPTEICRTGPYTWIRHPMYTGNLIALVGIIMLNVKAAILLVGYSFILSRAAQEENVMCDMPGYFDYYNKTGRFFPRIK